MAAIIEDDVVRSSHPALPIPTTSFTDFIFSQAEHHGDNVCFINGITGETHSYKKLLNMSRRVAAGLQARGLKPGDHVCFHCVNNVEFWYGYFGVILAGGVVVMAKPTLTPRELQYQIDDSKPVIVITDIMFVEKVLEVKKNVSCIREIILFANQDPFPSFASLMENDGSGYIEPPAFDPKEKTLMVIYSSGTTALPKGVMITHYSFVAQMVMTGLKGIRLVEPDDIYLQWMPCTHLSGVYVTVSSILAGSKCVVLPGFALEAILTAIQKFKITCLPFFPTFALILAQSPLMKKFDLSSLRTIIIGGSVTPNIVVQALKQHLNLKTYRHGIGITEAGGVVTSTPLYTIGDENCGAPIPMTEMKVIDVKTKVSLGPNQDGEICLRGPNLMKGYLNNPTATAEAIDGEGWLHTGDVGHYDDQGNFYIVDRVKDLIKCMDQQVPPAELETVLMNNPAVKEAAVIGIPHSQYGEVPRAYIVLKPDKTVSAEELSEYIGKQCADYKHLRGGIQFVEAIPKSETGKFLRRKLREEYLQSLKNNA